MYVSMKGVESESSSFATNVHSELAFILELSQFIKWFAPLKHELSVTASIPK